MKTAVIMAAGLGTRFGKYTESRPKGFIEVEGIPMIVRSVETLLSCGLSRILIGTGYKSEQFNLLKYKYPQIETCFSPRYAETNSMYTLFNMRDLIGDDDFILLESDLIYEKRAVTSLIESKKRDVMLISPVLKFQDQYYVETNSDLILTNCSIHKEELNRIMGELVGIHKLSNTFYKKMCDNYKTIVEEQPGLGYEYQLLRMSHSISPLYVLKVDDLKWYEIDDEEDLNYAEKKIIQYC
jgi:2-aminoethylphosphonate-pyruvate transaminase